LAILDVSPRLATEAERHRLQMQLAQARKLEAVGQLAAGVAHEINTPAQFIGDNLQFMRDACVELTAVVDAYRNARPVEVVGVDLDYLLGELPLAIDQALEGTALITEIVAAMKAFCHPGRTEKARTDLNAAIENVVCVSRNQWKYVATVDVELDPQLPLVSCNENELKQVLLNLVINASHAIEGAASRPGIEQRNSEEALGTIRVTSRHATGADYVEIEIADNGPGIRPEVIPNLFDPFFTTKEVGKGTGQGLAVAHAIVVEHHGGEIEIQYDSISTFNKF
jgi:signal transduction histidine kinase